LVHFSYIQDTFERSSDVIIAEYQLRELHLGASIDIKRVCKHTLVFPPKVQIATLYHNAFFSPLFPGPPESFFYNRYMGSGNDTIKWLSKSTIIRPLLTSTTVFLIGSNANKN